VLFESAAGAAYDNLAYSNWMVGYHENMPRRRIPLLIRALVLFVASLPMARAGGAGAHALGSLPAHESPAPAGAVWIRPAPIALVAGTLTVATAGAVIMQRSRSQATQALAIQQEDRSQSRAASSTAQSRPPAALGYAFALPYALVVAPARVFASGATSFVRRSLSTTVRARAPCGARQAAVRARA
jgi:hypothetical protein